MALRETWSENIKIKDRGRMVTYSAVPSFWDGKDGTVHVPIYWTVKRSSTMSFSYIGMTESAAEACAKSLRDEYTRHYMRWTPNEISNGDGPPTVTVNEDTSFELTSSIEPVHLEGDNWGVNASISETDEIVSLKELKTVADIEALFAFADQREYVWPSGSIAVASAKWVSSKGVSGVVEADYSPVVVNFDRTKLGAEIRDGDEWTPAVMYRNAEDGHYEFEASGNVTFRLVYDGGAVVSNEWTTNNRAIAKVTAIDAFAEFGVQSGWSEDSDYRTVALSVLVATSGAARASDAKSWALEFYSGGSMTYSVRPDIVTDKGGGVFMLSVSNGDIMFHVDSGSPVKALYRPDDSSSEQRQVRKVNYAFIESMTCLRVDAAPAAGYGRYTFEMRYSTDLAYADAAALVTRCYFGYVEQTCGNVTTTAEGGKYVRTWTCDLPLNADYNFVTAHISAADASVRSNESGAYDLPKLEDYFSIVSAVHEGTLLSVTFRTDYPIETWLGKIDVHWRHPPFAVYTVTRAQIGATDDVVVIDVRSHFDDIELYLTVEGTDIESNHVSAEDVT